jgi:hypothetical protein
LNVKNRIKNINAKLGLKHKKKGIVGLFEKVTIKHRTRAENSFARLGQRWKNDLAQKLGFRRRFAHYTDTSSFKFYFSIQKKGTFIKDSNLQQ